MGYKVLPESCRTGSLEIIAAAVPGLLPRQAVGDRRS